ncbi:thioredoxin family protein [Chitinophagales bacterium]|nr:thioredoxin family protein [Chitinophagales bacterium]
MKNWYLLALLFPFFIASCGGEAETANGVAADSAKSATTAPAKKAVVDGKVSWLTIDQLEQVAKTDKKKVMVDLYTSWCGWCKKMDKSTFQHGQISQYLNENFHAVKMDAEMKDNISFLGEDHAFKAAGRRGYNELAFKFAAGRMSYPTIAFLDEDLKRINSFPGFKQPHQFDPLLKFIAENHYESTDFRSFSSSYDSPIAPVGSSKTAKKPRVQIKKNPS